MTGIYMLAKNIVCGKEVEVEIIKRYEDDDSLMEVKYKGKNYLVKSNDLRKHS